jgi:pre-mRNA-processing factor 17
VQTTTQWHGKEAKDWQGKSWITAPKKSATSPDNCFLPKRWVHTWGADGSGHNKGVNCIRFFPKFGHLLLSAGLDSKIKVWDVHGSGKCMRTYLGHTAGVRQANFNHDGTRFVSVAYDKQMHLWDTETGQVCTEHNVKFLILLRSSLVSIFFGLAVYWPR